VRAYFIAPAVTGTRLELRDVAVPEPGAGELLVKVAAAGLNRGEFIQGHGVVLSAGAADARPCGTEAAGSVVRTGHGVEGWPPGTRVMGRCKAGFAEYALIDAREAMPVPERLSWEEAAAVPIVFLVTYDMLVEQGTLAAGEWVLVTGVSSGVGVASLQTALALGARVIGTSTSPAKLARLRDLGLHAALDADPARLPAAVRELTGGRGADLAVNAVGGSVFAACIDALAYKGRLATVGYVDGVLHADLDLLALHAKRLRLFGVSNRHRTAGERATTVAGFARDVLPQLASGRIRPLLDSVHAFDALPAAKARMEANAHVGKIVVRM
jgi:NADPH:quinone reductase-like Zn-dependent oxidoreductase